MSSFKLNQNLPYNQPNTILFVDNKILKSKNKQNIPVRNNIKSNVSFNHNDIFGLQSSDGIFLSGKSSFNKLSNNCEKGPCKGGVQISCNGLTQCYGSSGTWSSEGVSAYSFINRSESPLAITTIKKNSLYGCSTSLSYLEACNSSTTFGPVSDVCLAWEATSKNSPLKYTKGCSDTCFDVKVSFNNPILEGSFIPNIPPSIQGKLQNILSNEFDLNFEGSGPVLSAQVVSTQNVEPLWIPPYGFGDNNDVWTTTLSMSINLAEKTSSMNFYISHNNNINGSNTIFSASLTKNQLGNLNDKSLTGTTSIGGWLPNWGGGSGIDFSNIKLNAELPWNWSDIFA